MYTAGPIRALFISSFLSSPWVCFSACRLANVGVEKSNFQLSLMEFYSINYDLNCLLISTNLSSGISYMRVLGSTLELNSISWPFGILENAPEACLFGNL